MLGRQGSELAVRGAVVLDEDQVPNLDGAWVAGVDQVAGGHIGGEVDVDFAAWPTGPGVTHLPEVVLLVAGVDVRRIDVGDRGPELAGFGVRLDPFVLVALEVGRVEAAFVDAPDLGEQLPGPGDRLFLEVVAERPVAEHLEESVVVGVVPDVVEVIVLSAGADALLGVDGPGEGPAAGAEEDVLELVHARVGEHQGGVAGGHDRGGGHSSVALALEELDELAADLVGGSHAHGVILLRTVSKRHGFGILADGCCEGKAQGTLWVHVRTCWVAWADTSTVRSRGLPVRM